MITPASRTAAVAPSDSYRRTLLDRHGPDASQLLAGAGWGIAIGCLTGVLGALTALGTGTGMRGLLLRAVVGALAGGGAAFLLARAVPAGAGAAVLATVQPSGASCPAQPNYSYQESLAARGDIDAALASFEEVIAASPADPRPRLRAVDLYLRTNRSAERAAVLCREVHRLAGASDEERLYATQRLIDLYLGPLNAPGRALSELRRLADTYPDSRAGAHALLAIANIKRDMAGG